MLALLIGLVIRLFFAMVTLAIRIAWAIGFVVGFIIGKLLTATWDAWRYRHAGQVPLRSPDTIPEAERLVPPPPPLTTTSFTPRPLRPRPRR
jgi:hypothetical protein